MTPLTWRTGIDGKTITALGPDGQQVARVEALDGLGPRRWRVLVDWREVGPHYCEQADALAAASALLAAREG
jgi:hypothetical protein